MTVYKGKGVNAGIALGTAFLLQKKDRTIDNIQVQNSEAEWTRFLDAKKETDNQLIALFEKTRQELGNKEAMIIDVQRMMLEDEDFIEFIENLIKNERCAAHYAVSEAGKHFSAFFASLDDPYMSARSIDIADVSYRLTEQLLGNDLSINLPKPAVIVAEDLTPSETLQMDKTKILGFVIQKGSANSHTAILSQIMNIPCIVQCDITLDDSIIGKEIAVDGEAGLCFYEPDEATRNNLLKKQESYITQKNHLNKMRNLPTVTKSGKKISLYANIGSPDDLVDVLNNDSEGIGLFRSEFLYLGRSNFPSEDEQFEAYSKVAKGMGDKQVIIRTLDIGADKQVDYFNLDTEENPALGLRGIRICIERPEIFRTQLRAIYRASAFGKIAIMFPMISSLWEVRHAKGFAATVYDELKKEGHSLGKVEIGVMIETPAAVMIVGELAKEVDFFSVGTNDLTQYTLAVDRQNSKLENFFDAHHPAVIKMLEMVANAAKENNISAGICGELASDLSVTKTLIRQGFDKLSVSPIHTLKLREAIREME